MENGLIVLTTLKILGAILFLALAAAFQAGRVFSGGLRVFLVIQGITVLNYTRNVAETIRIRETHPAAFSIGTMPFLLLFPLLFLAVDASMTPDALRRRRFWIVVLMLAAIGGAIVAATAVIGRAVLLPGPEADPAVSWIWNAWHIGWTGAAAVLLIRGAGTGGASSLERRTLSVLVGYAAFVIAASMILENISHHLDFLVTPALMILAAYAALAILIAAAPRLIRQSRERYSGSDLDAQGAMKLAQRARKVIMSNELWRDGGLTLASFSAECAASPRDLSQAINQHFGTGFPSWVNTYRLDFAESQLEQTHQKVADIAFDSGFNTLSSFNAAFKARHGISPGEWRRTKAAD